MLLTMLEPGFGDLCGLLGRDAEFLQLLRRGCAECRAVAGVGCHGCALLDQQVAMVVRCMVVVIEGLLGRDPAKVLHDRSY